MNLNTYLEQHGAGAALARYLKVNHVMVSQWRYGIKQVPAERCPDIEAATVGAVTCEELRPDISWAVLRRRCDCTQPQPMKEAA